MKLAMRKYQDENDYWRIRQFLRDVMTANGLRMFSWTVQRLDYWRWHGLGNLQSCDPLKEIVFLWETPQGQIAAVLNPEESGDNFMHVHPAFKTTELESEMIAVAEERLSVTRNGKQKLHLWSDSQDARRQDILSGRGFVQTDYVESQWRRDLTEPLPAVSVADRYTVRALGGESELPARTWASWRGFHPNEPDSGYSGTEWYLNIQSCPLYRRDLDIVAVTGDVVAAFATLWFDDATRTVLVEPVATVPEHQRKGLARACITEGLRRAQKLGAVRAFVGGYEPGPDALYSSVLSPECDRYVSWKKEW